MTLLTELEAASFLNLKPACLRAWRQRKEGPPFARLGGVIRYRPDDLHRWVANATIQPAPSREVVAFHG